MIVAGFGFRSAVRVESLQAAFDAARSEHAIDRLATLEGKVDHPAFQAFARTLGLPIDTFSESALEAVQTATDSAASKAARQTGSVAEATALAAAGPGATLIQTRVVSADRMATCALANSQHAEGDI